jgi:hypothetical protein
MRLHMHVPDIRMIGEVVCEGAVVGLNSKVSWTLLEGGKLTAKNPNGRV